MTVLDPADFLISFGVYTLIFTPLERLLPRHPAPVLRRELASDAGFLLAGLLVVAPLAGLALAGVHSAITAILPPAPTASWPWWLLVPAAIVLGDLLTYGFHRASHAWDPLWRFHRVHHTAPHLDWIAAYREHPVDHLLTRLVENLPLMVLGVPLAWIAGIAAFRGLWALFIHSNIGWEPPRLVGALLGSPALHHRHHEPDARCNYANLSPLLDLAFRTYDRPGHLAGGYGDGTPPRPFWRLVTDPLTPASWRR